MALSEKEAYDLFKEKVNQLDRIMVEFQPGLLTWETCLREAAEQVFSSCKLWELTWRK